MRRYLIVHLSWALLAAWLPAPFFHLHGSEQAANHVAEHHSHGPVLHSHRTPAARPDPDEADFLLEAAEASLSAQDFDPFQLEEPEAPSTGVVLEQPTWAEPVRASSRDIRTIQSRIHDPPVRTALQPRAPPL